MAVNWIAATIWGTGQMRSRGPQRRPAGPAPQQDDDEGIATVLFRYIAGPIPMPRCATPFDAMIAG